VRRGAAVITPTPYQNGMTGHCAQDGFYFVKPGETCLTIAGATGTTTENIIAWNPDVGYECRNMWAYAYICIKTDELNNQPPLAIATPQPHQSGIVANCIDFAYVRSGDTCISIAGTVGTTYDNIIKWNPGVGPECRSMLADQWVCVRTY
jgi:spore germination protein YaaH